MYLSRYCLQQEGRGETVQAHIVRTTLRAEGARASPIPGGVPHVRVKGDLCARTSTSNDPSVKGDRIRQPPVGRGRLPRLLYKSRRRRWQ
jgi:hypothetical protein